MTQNRKRIIGITGGSGCGKSYISGLLRKKGIAVIDCDEVAHAVTAAGTPCLSELADFFGEEILENGGLNRKKLAEKVFSDESKLKKLNEITHKYILRDINNTIERTNSSTVCVDGAVLIESGMKCDKIVGILADKNIRRERIKKRDGISDERAQMRISAQKPDSFYIENCDAVFYNNSEGADTEKIIKGILE